MANGNKIWIELDKPGKGITDVATFKQKQCDLANKMLARLGVVGRSFFVGSRNCYCFGGDNGFRELVDNGEWFNLDYLGRDGE